MLGAGAGISIPCLDQLLEGWWLSIQCQYQQKEVYPNQVCMGNDCMQVCICIASFPGLSGEGERPGDYCVRMRENYPKTW